MNKQGKVFVTTSVAFGVFLAIVFASHSKPLIGSVVAGGIGGLLFGSFTAIFVWVASRSTKRRYGPHAEDVHQSRTMLIDRPVSEVAKACRDAALTIRKAQLLTKSQSETEIAVKVGMSWKSFGERINISIKSNAKGQSLVTIASTPSYSRTTLDYGKNFEDVELICHALSQRFNLETSKAPEVVK